MSVHVCAQNLYLFPAPPQNPPYIWKAPTTMPGEAKSQPLSWWLVCSMLLFIRVIIDKIIEGDFVRHLAFEKKDETF